MCLFNENMLHCLYIQIVASGFEHYLSIHPFSATYRGLADAPCDYLTVINLAILPFGQHTLKQLIKSTRIVDCWLNLHSEKWNIVLLRFTFSQKLEKDKNLLKCNRLKVNNVLVFFYSVLTPKPSFSEGHFSYFTCLKLSMKSV